MSTLALVPVSHDHKQSFLSKLFGKCKKKLSQMTSFSLSKKRRSTKGGSNRRRDGLITASEVSTDEEEDEEMPLVEHFDDLPDIDERRSSSIPLRLPFLLVRSSGLKKVELIGEHVEILVQNGLKEMKVGRGRDGVRVEEKDAYECGRAIATHFSGINQLWLDSSAANAEVARGIVDVYGEKEEKKEGGLRTTRFTIEQLTIISSKKPGDFDSLTRLIRLAHHSLVSIKMRRVRLHSEEASSYLWSSISLCCRLTQLQYEPTRLDTWSRMDIVTALKGKQLSSLILTGVEGLSAADLVEVASTTWMSDLSVVGELIRPSNLLVPAMKSTIEGLNSLLIQMDTWFSLSDCKERAALLELLLSLKEDATLEVVQVSSGSSNDAAKLMSYWIELAQESGRKIKLKLEDLSQERMDAALGRLVRKVETVRKVSWSSHSVSLSLGQGSLILLDKKTWFGDEE